jgi:ribose transport system permease protein
MHGGPVAQREPEQLDLSTIDVLPRQGPLARFVRAQSRDLGLFAVLVALMAYVTLRRDTFLTADNLRVIALGACFTAIPALSTAMLIILGKVDLSIGSIFGFGGILAATMSSHTTWWLAMLVGVLAGAGIGLINGTLVDRIKVSPLIVTLGSLTLVYGLNLVITKGLQVANVTDDFSKLGRGLVAGVPVPVIIWAAFAIAGAITLHICKVGRHMYAIGGDEEASARAGISVRRISLCVFTINGALAAFAGILAASRLGTADPTLGRGSELDILAAVILGGVAFTGGEGGLVGVVIACAFLATIDNALVALSIDPNWGYVVKGAILIMAVGLNQLAIEQRERHQRRAMLRAEVG